MIETVFAIVRHPFKRFASAYNHGARSGAVPKGMGPEEWFDKTVGALDLLPYRADNHLRPISDLVPERAVTFRLEDGLAPVINWIDTTFNTSSENALRDGNVAPKPSTDGFEVRPMSGPLKKRLQRLYAPDFERFGYDADASEGVMLHHPKPQSGNLAQLLRAKLLARRFEYRLRLLESRAMTAATNVQKPKRPAETRPGPSVEG